MLTECPDNTVCVTDPMLFQNGTLIFSGPRIPLLHEVINVIMNGLGLATVRGYKIFRGEDKDFLAVVVDFANPPAWFIRQNGGNVPAAVFGSDIEWEK